MCSVDPDEVVEMTQATEGLDITRGDVLCRKCGEAVAEVVLRVKDAYCRDCFLAYFVHKFRSTIGKSKLIKPGDRVVVGLSGGASSTALLHLIREGLNENSHKKLRFEPVFLHIDESALSEAGEDSEHIQKITSKVADLGFSCYVVSLEQVMMPEPPSPALVTQDWEGKKCPTHKDLRKKIHELFTSCKSSSARHDLHDQLRQTLLRNCAQALGFKKVFLGDNSTTLSIRILSQVAIGRGSQLATRVHFRAVSQNTEVYRPMREILQNEIHHYLRLRDIPVLKPPTFKPKDQSIFSCTEEFVLGLQKEFPATVPTIFRTGDKLVPLPPDAGKSNPDLSDSDPNSDCCAMCGSCLDTEKGEASALQATVVSQKLSGAGALEVSQQNGSEVKGNSVMDDCGVEEVDGGSCGCGRSAGGCGGGQTNADSTRNLELPSRDTLEHHLCYGCRIIVRDLEDMRHLPVSVRAAAMERERRRTMREQIQDFLL